MSRERLIAVTAPEPPRVRELYRYPVKGLSGESLASFTIVDCDSLDRALEIAALNPAARYVGVEVKPLLVPPERKRSTLSLKNGVRGSD